MKPIDPAKLKCPFQERIRIIDSHCHFAFSAFNEDREQCLKNATACGVDGMILIGAGDGWQGNQDVLDLVDTSPRYAFAAGCHPHDADQWQPDFQQKLKDALQHAKLVALGEIGLDFHYMHSTKDNQLCAFREQLTWAEERRLPVVIHSRSAHEELLEIAGAFSDHFSNVGGVVHCFSEGPREAENYLKLGLHLSFTGIATFPKAEEIREAIKITPLDRMMVETDAPFLAPVPFRGCRNEPAATAWVAQFLAALLDHNETTLTEQLTNNTVSFFGLDGSKFHTDGAMIRSRS